MAHVQWVQARLHASHASSRASSVALASCRSISSSSALKGYLDRQRASGSSVSSTQVNLIAGLFAGLAVDVPLHPLDTIKTRLQAREGFAASGGRLDLWRGLGPVVLRSLPCTALFFTAYDYSRQSLHGLQQRGPEAFRTEPPSWYIDSAAGAVANVVACTLRVPCEVLKQQMQARGVKQPLTMSSAAIHLHRAGGVCAFYQGFSATASRELAFALVQMPLFEELKRLHPKRTDNIASAGTAAMACGGLAGAMAGAVTTPLDVAKTQIMLADRQQSGVLSKMREIAATSGMRALWKGAGARTCYVGASCALSFGFFETAKSCLQ
eukprot:gb/GFBE01044240.1/.p1 GENE.gb/GFBE01044240.1/~~gb/GFBE01044240.1/.p1  ORF type:complete len:324 (+),score=31.57 gb/GFBE01044240.1/:1-972(+)